MHLLLRWDLFEDTGQHVIEEAGCDRSTCMYPLPPGNDRCNPYPFFCCDGAPAGSAFLRACI